VDHQSVLHRNLIERYVLGELASEEEAELEEHFFECSACAADIRHTNRLVANLKAENRDRIPVIALRPEDRFVDLTIRLKTPVSTSVDCECRCEGKPDPVVLTVSPQVGLIRLHVPAAAVSTGPCVVIVRDPDSRSELERHPFVVEKRSS